MLTGLSVELEKYPWFENFPNLKLNTSLPGPTGTNMTCVHLLTQANCVSKDLIIQHTTKILPGMPSLSPVFVNP